MRDPIGARMNQDGTNDSGLGEAEAEWLVAMGGDRPTPMTLDELDEAFRDGLIHEGTLVWARGMPAWIPLGELASAPGDGAHLESLLGHEPEQSEHPMDDQMPKEDPRLWNLSSNDARAARGFDMRPNGAQEEEMELGAEDLDDDVTPCGIPPRVVASAVFTPGVGAPSVPPRTTSSSSPTMPPRSMPPRSMPPRSMPPRSVPPRSMPPRSVPPRVSTLPRVPPPPRSRSLPPAAKVFESLPPVAPAVFESLPPIANITAFESTAPLVRTLSEPVIPIQPPPPGWNWRPWAAAAGMIFGLGAYGLSVLDLASSSPPASQRSAAAVAAAQTLPEPPQAEAASAPQAARAADVTSVASAAPVTAAIMPLASQAAADDASGLAREPERSTKTSASRKGKKARAKSWKKSKLAKTKTKASRSARSKPAAAAAAYEFLGMKK